MRLAIPRQVLMMTTDASTVSLQDMMLGELDLPSTPVGKHEVDDEVMVLAKKLQYMLCQIAENTSEEENDPRNQILSRAITILCEGRGLGVAVPVPTVNSSCDLDLNSLPLATLKMAEEILSEYDPPLSHEEAARQGNPAPVAGLFVQSEVYCICQRSAIGGTMIECTSSIGNRRCNGWVHVGCVGLEKKNSKTLEKLETYECPLCRNERRGRELDLMFTELTEEDRVPRKCCFCSGEEPDSRIKGRFIGPFLDPWRKTKVMCHEFCAIACRYTGMGTRHSQWWNVTRSARIALGTPCEGKCGRHGASLVCSQRSCKRAIHLECERRLAARLAKIPIITSSDAQVTTIGRSAMEAMKAKIIRDFQQNWLCPIHKKQKLLRKRQQKQEAQQLSPIGQTAKQLNLEQTRENPPVQFGSPQVERPNLVQDAPTLVLEDMGHKQTPKGPVGIDSMRESAIGSGISSQVEVGKRKNQFQKQPREGQAKKQKQQPD